MVEGRPDEETVYAGDPVTVAHRWEVAGAKMLHVVDLDGAFAGRPVHLPLIKEIVAAVEIPVQVGGGIRNRAAVEAVLACGVARVILGTAAAVDSGLLRELVRKFGARVMASVDCRQGVVAVHGWRSLAGLEAVAFGRELKTHGVERVVFTDIARDGTLTGPNIAAVESFARATGLKVIASGGISRLEDIQALRSLEVVGVEAVIIGRALYDGRFSLEEAIAVAEGKEVAGQENYSVP